MQMGIQEALTGVFTDDPLNWVKWAAVFAVLILGFCALNAIIISSNNERDIYTYLVYPLSRRKAYKSEAG